MNGFLGRLRELIWPRQVDFLAMLEEQAHLTMLGLEALARFSTTGDPAHAEEVRKLETEEDDRRRILIHELNRTFVTPIDREDIFALSRALDDVLDYANTTVDEMIMLKVEPNEFVRRMVVNLKEAAEELYRAVKHLKHHPQVATDHAVRAKGLENRAEQIYREALSELFDHSADVQRIVYVLKMREVYRHLSNAADRGDEAADIITDIVVKTT
jgi:predicted phosphate transport protein (TIGR00153 family)